ncbi:sugar phosphate isomerase/epimerase [Paenibacillus phyllosphaerae]|uniref:Sugar phosphate isomerase/epimerase n=1 Tax=Paenibacillus phyllosphaerae TaxID=274593 RepID=A0A7W5FRG1_9BACL|nr:sugar phosphate isomerase/epimerase family protein [Paenibacillus phyllosphaerae]MBB3114490.1 sugar phosphate isomerase/epimerase [Paenibacillus phyllosphaerae]
MFPFKAALNASTLFPFRLTVPEFIRVAADAGYDGVELWVSDIERYLADGGTAEALRACLDEAGLTFANAIAFFRWADKDPAVREAAFLQAEQEMKLLQELGCLAIAAPPYGDVAACSPEEFAASLDRLVQLGRRIGIEPYLEFWGRAPKLSTLSEAVEISSLCGETGIKLLLDPFHMYTGGSAIPEIERLNGDRIGIFHVNDYPSEPDVTVIADNHRVFPGKGIAPSREIASTLHRIGYEGYLSLELFLEHYEGLSALEVARKGLAAMKETYAIEEE